MKVVVDQGFIHLEVIRCTSQFWENCNPKLFMSIYIKKKQWSVKFSDQIKIYHTTYQSVRIVWPSIWPYVCEHCFATMLQYMSICVWKLFRHNVTVYDHMCVKIVSPQCYSICPYVCENCFATMCSYFCEGCSPKN